MKKTYILLISLAFLMFGAYAQVGIGTSNPSASSILDLNSTSKGLLIPRMTQVQRNSISSPVAGLMIFNTDCGVFNYYTGTTWASFPNVGTNPIGTPGPVSGYLGVCNNQSGVAYSTSSVPGATGYTWTVPTGATVTAGQGTPNATVTFGTTSGSVCVIATSACNTSSPSCTGVTVISTAPAQPGSISGIGFPSGCVCEYSEDVEYSVDEVPGTNYYTWTVPLDWTIVSGQGTRQIIVNTGYAGGNITVKATNGCGTGATRSQSITVCHPPDC